MLSAEEREAAVRTFQKLGIALGVSSGVSMVFNIVAFIKYKNTSDIAFYYKALFVFGVLMSLNQIDNTVALLRFTESDIDFSSNALQSMSNGTLEGVQDTLVTTTSKYFYFVGLLIDCLYYGCLLLIITTRYLKIRYPFIRIRTKHVVGVTITCLTYFITVAIVFIFHLDSVFIPIYLVSLQRVPRSKTLSLTSSFIFSLPIELSLFVTDWITTLTLYELMKLRRASIHSESKIKLLESSYKVVIMGLGVDVVTLGYIVALAVLSYYSIFEGFEVFGEVGPVTLVAGYMNTAMFFINPVILAGYSAVVFLFFSRYERRPKNKNNNGRRDNEGQECNLEGFTL